MELTILGMAPSRELCDWKSEVWSVNTGYRQISEMNGHVEKIFLAHTQVPDPSDGVHIFDWEEMNRLADAGCEIYNIHRIKELKHKMYPIKAISEKFETNYFSNTIAYMIAYALYKYTKKVEGKLVLKEPLKLNFWGVDMLERLPGGFDEYTLEKGCVEYWVGMAKGLGVEINIPQSSELLKTFNRALYGKKWYKLWQIDPFGLLKGKGKTKESRMKRLTSLKNKYNLDAMEGEFLVEMDEKCVK